MSIRVGDKISYTHSRIDNFGIEVFGKYRRGTVEKIYFGEDGFACAVRYRGKIDIVLDTQVNK